MKLVTIIPLMAGVLGGVTVGWFAKGATATQDSAQVTQSPVTKSRTSGQSSGSDHSASVQDTSAPGISFQNMRSSVTHLSDQQVSALGEEYSNTSDPVLRSVIFNKMLASMTEENALLLRKHVQRLSHNDPDFKKFHYMYGKIGGEEALSFGLKSPEGDGGDIFRGWASTDPNAAKDWLNNLSEEQLAQYKNLTDRGFNVENLTKHLEKDLVEGMFLNDPQEAANYLSNLGEGQDLTQASRLSQSLVRDIVHRQGPDAALEWVAHLGESKVSHEAIGELADEWSETHPNEALAWAKKQQSGEGRQKALYEVMKNIGAKVGGADPYSAAEEINQMGASLDKDYALSGYARGISGHYPQTAFEAALEIEDKDLRERSVIRAGQNLLRRMPQIGQEALANSGISEELQAQIKRTAGRK